MNHTVGIGEMRVSSRPEDVLVTYSLGSCVGLAVYDPVACVGGLIHCMLPLSKIDLQKACANPCMFTDLGAQVLLQTVFDHGAEKRRLVVKVAGAAEALDREGVFKIGERNYTVLRKVLWKNDILIAAEDIGGTSPRTLTLYMDNGRTTVRSRGQEVEL